VVSTGTPAGTGGRDWITTGMPSSPAARSLASVIAPPLSLVTSTSMRCSRSSSRSASRVNGPLASSVRSRGGIGGSGGSTERTRNQCSPSPANAASPPRPVVRKTRRPSPGSASAAAASVGTQCQRSPSPGVQPGRRSTSSGIPSSVVAAAAEALMVAANGWVASTTAAIRSARR
jgi:hypothetical protein